MDSRQAVGDEVTKTQGGDKLRLKINIMEPYRNIGSNPILPTLPGGGGTVYAAVCLHAVPEHGFTKLKLFSQIEQSSIVLHRTWPTLGPKCGFESRRTLYAGLWSNDRTRAVRTKRSLPWWRCANIDNPGPMYMGTIM
ncbi:hypothetical protein LCGC14_0828010 [marine sediment metagenome]|uniref:Uncharacterized protein n=1 Tax=marine sediment metagenome TaxID=412755 RepID=A0A0F9PGU4_9ZZZZ